MDLYDMGTVWTGLVWLKIGKEAYFCECRNEGSGSVKCWELLDQLRACYILKGDCTPRSCLFRIRSRYLEVNETGLPEIRDYVEG
jgi:hypothetical protein